MPEQYKLIYFDCRGRAEPARLIFHFAKQPYEDVRLEGHEFFNLKSTLPNGQLPVLEVDGQVISQSMSIIRFLGKKFGLAGKDEFESAKADEVLCVCYDRFQEQLPYFVYCLGFSNPDNIGQLYSETFVPSAIKSLDYYASLINDNQKTILSSGPSYIDFVVADHIESINHLYPESKSDYRQLFAFKNGIYSLPQLSDYIRERKRSAC